MPTPDHPNPIERSQVLAWIITMSIGGVFGFIYTYFAYIAVEDAQGRLWLGVFIGVMIAALASGFEIFVIGRPQSVFRRMSFIPLLVLRTLILTSMMLLSIMLGQYLHDQIHGTTFLQFGPQDLRAYAQDLVFSLLICGLIIFYIQMRLFIGGRTLTNLLLGRYNQPVSEERIFMFIDLLGATKTARQIGDVDFHRYLNELFILFDRPITRNGGEVHSYVGDAIIVIWPLNENPAKNARALTALREIQSICERQQERMKARYGVVPGVRAALHGGHVVTGETGYSKRQITYLGDTVNITSRIENIAKVLGRNFLVSEFLERRMTFPDNIQLEQLGEFEVKGADEPVRLSQIHFLADGEQAGALHRQGNQVSVRNGTPHGA